MSKIRGGKGRKRMGGRNLTSRGAINPGVGPMTCEGSCINYWGQTMSCDSNCSCDSYAYGQIMSDTCTSSGGGSQLYNVSPWDPMCWWCPGGHACLPKCCEQGPIVASISPSDWKIIEEGALMSVIDCVKCAHATQGGDGNVHNCVSCVSSLTA